MEISNKLSSLSLVTEDLLQCQAENHERCLLWDNPGSTEELPTDSEKQQQQ